MQRTLSEKKKKKKKKKKNRSKGREEKFSEAPIFQAEYLLNADQFRISVELPTTRDSFLLDFRGLSTTMTNSEPKIPRRNSERRRDSKPRVQFSRRDLSFQDFWSRLRHTSLNIR
jgi:hypothetical protein